MGNLIIGTCWPMWPDMQSGFEPSIPLAYLCIYSYRMSPEDIRRESLGKEVRSLLRCRHVDQLYLLSGYLVADPLDVDVLGALVMHWIHGKLSS